MRERVSIIAIHLLSKCFEASRFGKVVGDLVVEQTGVLLDEGDAELLSGLEDGTVVLGTAGSRNVLDAGASGAVDIVDEGELAQLS